MTRRSGVGSVRALAFGVALALTAGSCGDDDAVFSTVAPTSPAPVTTSVMTTSEATTSTTAGPVSTTSTPIATSTTTTAVPEPTTTLPPGAFVIEPANLCVIDTAPGDALNVRSGPGTDHPVVGVLPFDGVEVFATGPAVDVDGSTWLHVAHGDVVGWAASWYLTPDPCEVGTPGGFCVTDTLCTDRLNVRSGPGGDYPKIGSLAHDAVGVTATGVTTTDGNGRVWTQIIHQGRFFKDRE